MTNLKFLLLFLFFPFFGSSQSLNGVYTGVLSNDSTTVRKDQSFEMALTEYNGKVYGYAYSTFIVNDTLYYIVKRVKGKVEGDICEVEDDEVISHNFPQKPEKKVFVSYTLRRNIADSSWKLDGNWKTNVTKKYYAISGKVETKEEKDLSKSKLYEHLGDLDLQKTLAFSKPKETTPEKKPVKAKDNKNDVAKNTKKKEEKNDIVKTDTKTADKKPDASITKADTKPSENKTSPVSVNDPLNQTDKKDAIVSATNTTEKKVAVNNPSEKKDAIVSNKNTTEQKSDSSVAKNDTKLPGTQTTSNPIINPPVQNEKKNELASTTNTVDKKPETAVVKPETKLPDNKPVVTATNNQQNQNEKKDVIAANTNTVDKKPETAVVKTENKLPDNKPIVAATNDQQNQNEKKDVIAANTKPVEKKPETNIAKTETRLPDNKVVSSSANNQPTQNVKKDVVAVNTNNNTAVKPETKQSESKLVSVPVGYQPSQNTKKDIAVASTQNDKTATTKPETKTTDIKTTATNTPVNQNEKVAASQKKAEAEFEFQEINRNRTNRTLKPAAALVDGRETKPSETIFFRSDSISIALYDNGEVDGDTVSVIINDVMFVEKQGLKSSAFRKTFYIPPGESDSLLVVLYANNLGKYPPNTGLLQIKDGEEIFYVRFKADLDQNAAILLRRKNK